MAEIKKLIADIVPKIIELRHQIHANPELSGKEFETSALIRKTLAKTMIKFHDPFLETDVVGILEGKGKGVNVTLRADMDALPLDEHTGVPYTSKNKGVMHACGHDGHTAILMGAALVLNELRDTFSGSVRFVFQPGEEGLALGKPLVEAGALKNPEPALVLAQHGWPGTPVGSLTSMIGPAMAGAYMFKIIINGKGGHGAHPEMAIDPILTSARVIEALQAIPSRMVPAMQSAVVSICHIDGGGNANVIPNSVLMEGTARYHNPEIGEKIPKMIEQIVGGVCQSMGATYEISYDTCYLPVINAAEAVELGRKVTEEVLGKDAWVVLDQAVMGSEDFAFYLQDYVGAQFRLGLGPEVAYLHNPKFNFNDGAISNGITFFVATALARLNQG
ncbi:MAG: amidohydrolase [Planctomycetes bacterium]|nr:amidohydrolase [Planctomycetota bacterium]